MAAHGATAPEDGGQVTRAGRIVRRVDGFQQRHGPIAFLVAVVKKYGDDNAGTLVVQLTYSMFLTVFPLLLLLVTVLGIVLANDPSLRQRVATSAFGQFPIIGTEMSHQIRALRRGSPFGLAVGIAGLLYGCTGLAQSGLYAMSEIWCIPGPVRPRWVARFVRSLAFIALLGFGLALSTGLASFGTFGRHDAALGYLAEVLAAALNVGLYLAAFRLLTPKQIPTRWLVAGAVFGGLVWTVLQALGGYVVGHDLKGASATYGMFGLVLGLVAWIYLGAEVTVYSAEVNTVLYHHLWTRALVTPPLTDADQRSIALQSLKSQVRPEQVVMTKFRQRPMTEDEYRDRDYRLDPRDGHRASVPEAGGNYGDPTAAAREESPTGR